ncbi:hypothetical protein HMPREF1986_00660 [Oribacterium sp. oral taxon 078 str. F0263]|nr:hypothetical protein HMPREF1986_00660 [Oribacterium sp. oral taxon 078 str. F0263]
MSASDRRSSAAQISGLRGRGKRNSKAAEDTAYNTTKAPK